MEQTRVCVPLLRSFFGGGFHPRERLYSTEGIPSSTVGYDVQFCGEYRPGLGVLGIIEE